MADNGTGQGRVYDSVLDLIIALDSAVTNALQSEELSGYIKDILQSSIMKNVYSLDRYTPRMYKGKRRYENGGLADPDNMEITLNGGGIKVEDVASGHQVDGWWETIPADDRIDDYIESGSYNVDFTHNPPGPRPFYKPAEEMLDEDRMSQIVVDIINGEL